MKSNGKPSGGSLASGSEDAYANYLIDFIKAYTEKFGIEIYAISPSNDLTAVERDGTVELELYKSGKLLPEESSPGFR